MSPPSIEIRIVSYWGDSHPHIYIFVERILKKKRAECSLARFSESDACFFFFLLFGGLSNGELKSSLQATAAKLLQAIISKHLLRCKWHYKVNFHDCVSVATVMAQQNRSVKSWGCNLLLLEGVYSGLLLEHSEVVELKQNNKKRSSSWAHVQG